LEHRASVKHFVSLQFLNFRRWDCLEGGSACRKTATYTVLHKHRKKAVEHLCL
jgi:hypothetical protein